MTTSTPPSRRAVAIALSVVAAGVLLVVGYAAFGDPSPGFAAVDVRDKVYPGDTPDISVTLKDTGPINYAKICPRAGIVPVSGSSTGWTARVVTTQCIRFTSPDLQVVGPSGVVFKIASSIAPSDKDKVVGWTAVISRDGGTTISDPLLEESAGALKTNVRVLRVEAVGITAPAGAAAIDSPAGAPTNYTVTGGQKPVTVTTVVKNLSTVTQSVTPTLTTASPAKVDSSPGAVNIGAGGVASFGSQVSFEDVTQGKTATFAATAKAPTSMPAPPVPKVSATVEVQPATTFVCSKFAGPGDTLTATQLVGAKPGGAPVFQATIVKTGIQSTLTSVTVTVDPEIQKFAATATGVSLPAGPDAKSADVTFPAMNVPTTATRGDFDTSFKFAGKDVNDAAIDQTIEGRCNPTPAPPALPTGMQQPAPKTLVRLDGEIPEITPTITGPTSGGGVKNGDALTLSAKIKDGGGRTCKVTIESAKILEFDAAGVATPNDKAISLSVTPGDGECSASSAATTFTFKDTTKEIAFQVGARDLAKNFGLGLSTRVPVDLTIPKVVRAFTLTSKSIQVDFTEKMYGAPSLLDWGVPVRADDTHVPPLAKALGRHIVLDFMFQEATSSMEVRLLDELDLDETPMLCYGGGICAAPLPLLSPLTDGAGNALSVPTPVQVDDRLGAAALTLSKVDGHGPSGDAFPTNKDKPEFALTGAVAGHTAEVWEDIDHNGKVGGSDVKLGSIRAVGSDVTITPTVSLSAGEGRKDVISRAIDTAGNIGTESKFVVALDKTALKLSSALARRASGLPLSSGTIEVKFSEPIASGANSADDWILRDAAGNEYVIGGVTATDATTRTLRIGDPTWVDHEGPLTLRYFGTSSADAYADAAGNKMGDASVTVQEAS